MTPSDYWQTRLSETPDLASYLQPVAKKWAKGIPLPKNITLGPEPKEPAIRTALDRIFGKIHYRNGKVVAVISDPLRDETTLQALATELGIEKRTHTPKTAHRALQRIRLTYPQLHHIHHWLEKRPLHGIAS